VRIVIAALVCAAACSGSHAASNASPSPAVTPVAQQITSPPAWPTYRAADYRNPGAPKLTPAQAALIRKTLAIVKPCQRALLRYAFPDYSGYSGTPPPDMRMVLFFGGYGAHVLWQPDLYWFPDQGTAHAIPYDSQPTPDFSIQADIANAPCR
jgi:hypothetical protein